MKYTVCVDFDGVIHRYDTPWVSPSVIPDEPVDGAIEWLHSMVQRFTVVIFSTRCRSWRGRRAIRKWLYKHSQGLWYESPAHLGIEEIKLSAKKPPALVYIDDRAFRFEGDNFPLSHEIHQMKPWHKIYTGDPTAD